MTGGAAVHFKENTDKKQNANTLDATPIQHSQPLPESTITPKLSLQLSKVQQPGEPLQADLENHLAMAQIKENIQRRRPTLIRPKDLHIDNEENNEILSKYTRQSIQKSPQQQSPLRRMKPLSSSRTKLEVQNETIKSKSKERDEQMQAKLKRKRDSDLSKQIGYVYGKGPFFEYPVMNFNEETQAMMEQMQAALNVESGGNNSFRQGSPSKWKTVTSVITNKFKQQIPLKEMLQQNSIKDKIFDKIFEKFSRGKKLKRYDVYLNEELSRQEMKRLRNQVMSKDKNGMLNQKNAKKMKQLQLQQAMENLKKQAEQKEKEEQAPSYMQTKHSKNYQLTVIKQAVDKNQLTLDEANEILLQQNKQLNQGLMKTVRDSKFRFDTLVFELKKKLLARQSRIDAAQREPSEQDHKKEDVFMEGGIEYSHQRERPRSALAIKQSSQQQNMSQLHQGASVIHPKPTNQINLINARQQHTRLQSANIYQKRAANKHKYSLSKLRNTGGVPTASQSGKFTNGSCKRTRGIRAIASTDDAPQLDSTYGDRQLNSEIVDINVQSDMQATGGHVQFLNSTKNESKVKSSNKQRKVKKYTINSFQSSNRPQSSGLSYGRRQKYTYGDWKDYLYDGQRGRMGVNELCLSQDSKQIYRHYYNEIQKNSMSFELQDCKFIRSSTNQQYKGLYFNQNMSLSAGKDNHPVSRDNISKRLMNLAGMSSGGVKGAPPIFLTNKTTTVGDYSDLVLASNHFKDSDPYGEGEMLVGDKMWLKNHGLVGSGRSWQPPQSKQKGGFRQSSVKPASQVTRQLQFSNPSGQGKIVY